MKDQIDDRMRIKVMPDMGAALDNLCNTYVQFFNSQDKIERQKLLVTIGKAASDCAERTKATLEYMGANVFARPYSKHQ